jgi:DNA polymerase
MRDLARALLAHVEYHRALGVAGVPRAERIDAKRSRATADGTSSSGEASIGERPGGVTPTDGPIATLDDLRADIGDCTRCKLAGGRTNLVFGVGNPKARVVFVGEGPGADEDRIGEPFVGRAGQLLNAMLHSIGQPRAEVYIANILKCRPPGNRDPQPDEAASCTPYLTQQIALVRPRAILAVGRIAAQWLLQSDAPIGRLRGRVFQYGDAGTPLVVTYHPAYLLRSPGEKAKAWTDLCMVRDLLSNQR